MDKQVAQAFVTPRDKFRSLGFSPGKSLTVSTENAVFQPLNLRLTPLTNLRPRRQRGLHGQKGRPG
ncbi:MAG: hypothetical protein RIT02_1542 [Planctomycetota bacterium]|jgi:hypothetical protein